MRRNILKQIDFRSNFVDEFKKEVKIIEDANAIVNGDFDNCVCLLNAKHFTIESGFCNVHEKSTEFTTEFTELF